MMYAYYDRNGDRRLGDAEEVYNATSSTEYERAYADYIDDYVEEPYIMRNSYRPSRVFREWSGDDFARCAREWFYQVLSDGDGDVIYLEPIGITPVTNEDINGLFDRQFGERREYFRNNKPRPRRPPTPVERARQSSKGRTSSNSTRSKNKGKATVKAKPKAKPKAQTRGRC